MLALCVILTVKGAISAHGNGTNGELRPFLALSAPQFRSEANGKLHDLDARHPGENKVAELVHHHQNA